MIITLIIIFTSFLIIFTIKLYVHDKLPDIDCTALNVPGTVSVSEAVLMFTTQDQINCYCKQQGIDAIFSKMDLDSFCSSYIGSITKSISMNFFITSCIVLVNFSLKISMKYLSKHERFQRKTSKRMYMLLKLFIAMFINTAISTLMAYFSFVSDNMSI